MSEAATKRAALLIAILSAFLTPFMGAALNIALPSIGQELAASAVLLGWISLIYLLAAAVFLLPFGRLADITGRKKVFVLGTGVFTLGSVLCALANSTGFLLAFRVVQGIGSAMIFGTGTAILTSVYPGGERGRVLGLSVAATYIGLSIGPFLGGLLTQHLGWRSIFWAVVPLGLITIPVALWQLKGEWADAAGEKFDWVGALVLGIALVALIYGFTLLPAAPGIGLVAAGVLGIAGFAIWETRTPSPLLNVRLFGHNRTFALSNLAALVNYSATSAIGFLLSLYLQYVKGFNPESAGTILLAQPVMQAVFSPASGQLSDRIEPRVVASTGMGITALGLVMLIFLGDEPALWFIIASLLLLGFGFALFSSPNVNAIMGSVERRDYGVGSATLATMRLTGQMLSLGIATMILALYVGQSEITPGNHALFIESTTITFAIFAALCFAGIFASLARGTMHT
jgi:EmrB/QacA subfamily drug resistance transporter